jgi:hypothetical protein
MRRLSLACPMRLVTVASAVVLFGGCGGAPAGPKVYPIVGKVLVDGRPAHHAQVVFHAVNPPAAPEGLTIRPFAVVEADGSFRPSTFLTADGAPSGDYKITITWPETRVEQGEEIAGPDRLAGVYAHPANSNLSVTVQPGENNLPPFELKGR